MTALVSEGPPATVFFDEKTKEKMKEKVNEKVDNLVKESVKPILYNAAGGSITEASPCIGPAVKNRVLSKTPRYLTPFASKSYDACYEPSVNSTKKCANKGIDISVELSAKESKKKVNGCIDKKPEKMQSIFSIFFPRES